MEYRVHKIAEWISGLCKRYEDWLMDQGRVEEAWRLRELVKETDKQYFYDWNMSPFEAKVVARRNWTNAFFILVQGLGYPNLLDVGYVND